MFPVVESRSREDEQSLVAWFLGLRPPGEPEDGGFGHSIDPIPGARELPLATGDILSYLVRDFVHALPGIRQSSGRRRHHRDGATRRFAGTSITRRVGARVVARLPGSPTRQAPQDSPWPRRSSSGSCSAWSRPHRFRRLPDGVSDTLRDEAVNEVSSALEVVVAELAPMDRTEVVRAFLGVAPLSSHD